MSTTTATNRTPTQGQMTLASQPTTFTTLNDMLFNYLESIIDKIQKHPLSHMSFKFINMFCLQIFLINLLLFIYLLEMGFRFSIYPAVFVTFLGNAFGIYAFAKRNPILMMLFSLINVVGIFGFAVRLYHPYSNFTMNFSLVLLILNQLRAFGYIFEFGKEKMEEKKSHESIIETIVNV